MNLLVRAVSSLSSDILLFKSLILLKGIKITKRFIRYHVIVINFFKSKNITVFILLVASTLTSILGNLNIQISATSFYDSLYTNLPGTLSNETLWNNYSPGLKTIQDTGSSIIIVFGLDYDLHRILEVAR